MLEIGKIERGEFTLDVKTFDLKAVIDDTIAAVSKQIAGKHQILRRTMPHEHVIVSADAEKFGEVLVNLLQNASKYTPEHGSIELVGTLVGAPLNWWCPTSVWAYQPTKSTGSSTCTHALPMRQVTKDWE
jgi:signal transduction histidine kinase